MVVDVEAVKRARLGDKESFGEVYQQIADDLYRVALYSLGNAHDAQDVVSETFMEAYKGIKNLRDEGSFKAWIMRILSIRCKRKIGQYIAGRNELDIDDFLDLSDRRGGGTLHRKTGAAQRAGDPHPPGAADCGPGGGPGLHRAGDSGDPGRPPGDGELQAPPDA